MDKQTTTAEGPFRITVEPISAGVTLGIEPFVQSVMHDAVELLLGDEFAERLDEINEAQPADRHTVQRPAELLFEQLVADLTDRVGTRVPVYGVQVLRLADRLRERGENLPGAGRAAPERDAA